MNISRGELKYSTRLEKYIRRWTKSASSWFAETTSLTLNPALAVRITFYRLMALLIDPFQPTLALGEAETVVYY
jgi:hypothetical protein